MFEGSHEGENHGECLIESHEGYLKKTMKGAMGGAIEGAMESVW
jgi:hypothetical protein